MPPKKIPFNAENEAVLIFEVQRRPLLWDISLQEYRRNDLKDTHWDEVARAVGPSFTGDVVKERFINMRTTFMNNEKRVRESKDRCSGTSSDEIYKPKWPLYSSLLFLKKTVTQTSGRSNLTTQDYSTQSSLQSTLQSTLQSSIQSSTQLSTSTLGSAGSSNGSNSYSISIPLDSPDNGDPVYFDENSIAWLVPHEEESESVSSASHTSPLTSPSTPAPVARAPSLSPPPRPNSAPSSSSNNKRGGDEEVFVKRRSAKKKAGHFMEDAVEALRKISEQKLTPAPQRPQPPQPQDTFAAFIAARLQNMSPDSRKQCEDEILKVLLRPDW